MRRRRRAFDLLNEELHFQLYVPEMRGRVHRQRVVFDAGAVPGAAFRYDSHGWGLIQLYLTAARDGRLGASHTNHNSEARARKWEPTYQDSDDRVADWDWRAVQRFSSRLNWFIRAAGVAKAGSRPLLPHAQAALLRGRLFLVP